MYYNTCININIIQFMGNMGGEFMFHLLELDKVYVATKTIMTGVYAASVGTLDVVCGVTRVIMQATHAL